MKRIKHIWWYLTSPMYRAYCDLLLTQQSVDANLNMMKDNLLMAKLPPLTLRYMADKGIDNPFIAEELMRVQFGMKKL